VIAPRERPRAQVPAGQDRRKRRMRLLRHPVVFATCGSVAGSIFTPVRPR
jgi:hypothetical protein